MSASRWDEREVLIAVKTYPNPSMKYGETVCVAGVDVHTHEWLRIYPVQFRDLPEYMQFAKYAIVQVRLRRHERDPRPESHRPDWDSFQTKEVLPADGGWDRRRAVIEPAVSDSMCAIRREQKEHGRSLGCFRPTAVEDFVIEADSPQWDGKQRMALSQLTFFDDRTPLEKVPLKFKYRFRCSEPECNGHRQSVLDWEVYQLYRKLKGKRMSLDMIKSKLRQKFLGELCGEKRDTHFFVGNHSAHPASFMVLGVFWPPRKERTLFDT